MGRLSKASTVQPGAFRARDPDAAILDIASRQDGVVSRRELLRAGVTAHAIDYRLKRGRLRAVHRGVYRSGPVEGRYQNEMAALLACGDRAVLSHHTAAALWQLVPSPGPKRPVEVMGPRSLRGPRHGVRLHRPGRLDRIEIREKHGLPLTAPERTLLDLAVSVGTHELERALAQAERQGLVTPRTLAAVLARHPSRPGGPRLRALLQAVGGPTLTRSEAESRFLALVRKGAVPRPDANVFVEGLEVDFLWRDHRLVVEIDGYAYHEGRPAFERDRQRDGVLAAAGYRVMRLTWRQLTEEPEVVLVRLAQALVAGGP